MPEEQATAWLWLSFRLYLAELSEPQIDGVLQQLENEIAARRQCDTDAARLLFSTLSASDLEIARQQIINAQQIEAEARQMSTAPNEAKALPPVAAHSSRSLGRQPRAAVSPHNSGPPAQNALACESGQSDECDDRGRRCGPKEKRSQMTAFTITEDNNITAFRSASEAAQAGGPNTLTFDSPAALASIAAEWPMSRLVEIYNSIPGNGEVKRFADRNKAVARIWEALQPLGRTVAAIEVSQLENNTTEPSNAPASAPARRKPPKREASPRANKAGNTASRRNTKLRHAGQRRGGPPRQQEVTSDCDDEAPQRRHARRNHGRHGLAGAHGARHGQHLGQQGRTQTRIGEELLRRADIPHTEIVRP